MACWDSWERLHFLFLAFLKFTLFSCSCSVGFVFLGGFLFLPKYKEQAAVGSAGSASSSVGAGGSWVVGAARPALHS